MTPIRVVLIGLGNMGRHHLRAITEDERFQLVAVVDPEVLSLPHRESSIPVFKKLEDLGAMPYEAAVVASPTTTHKSLVSQLLDLSKHVLVEKPAASSLEEARFLVGKAESNKLHLAVGHIERCNPVVDALAQVLAKGVLGTPVHVAANRCGAYPRSISPGNHVFLDLAVHELDVMARLFDHLEVKDGFYHCLQEDRTPDVAEVRLGFAGGGQATVHVNWLTPQKMRTLRVTGTDGVCELDYIAQSLRVYSHSLSPHLDLLATKYHLEEHPFCQLARIEVPAGEPIKRQLSEFYQLVTGGEHSLCTGRGILDSLRLLDDCFEKAQTSLSPSELSRLKGENLHLYN